MIPINRRQFLSKAGAAAALAAVRPHRASAAPEPPRLTAPEVIRERVRKARPLHGGPLPRDLKDKLGLTHYDGHYHLTDKPFLIEGAEAIQRLGMNVAKFWLREDDLPGYGYNSRLREALPTGRLVEVLRHEEYQTALALPFTTVFLEIFPLVGNKQTFFAGDNNFKDEEEQFHEVAVYLQKTYHDRDIPYIVHWELYCNEPADGTKADRRPRQAHEMRGFWYLRPDGSLSHGGRYLDALLKHAGGTLPEAAAAELRKGK